MSLPPRRWRPNPKRFAHHRVHGVQPVQHSGTGCFLQVLPHFLRLCTFKPSRCLATFIVKAFKSVYPRFGVFSRPSPGSTNVPWGYSCSFFCCPAYLSSAVS